MYKMHSTSAVKVNSIQDQLHDYGMSGTNTRLITQSELSTVTLGSDHNVIPYSNDFFKE